MTYTYTYEIVSVDVQARCMEVRYETSGKPPINVGTRLPSPDEPLEMIIESYAPVGYWADLDRQVVIPQVGHTGVVIPEQKSVTVPDETTYEQVPLQEI